MCFSFARETFVLVFGRQGHGCHSSPSSFYFEIAIDKVTHMGNTQVPRTVILNTIPAISKLQGTSGKVRNPLS